MANEIQWHEVLPDLTLLPEGRVMTAVADGHREICLTHYRGKICALDNRCPHQGGPLGEGSIEKGLLRCPWHGWDYDPCTGKAPGYDHGVLTYPVEIRDGALGIRVTRQAELEEAMNRVLGHPGTALLEVCTDPALI
jgi:nitrite reductase/ring-hydroxylating ferredoxin subunit